MVRKNICHVPCEQEFYHLLKFLATVLYVGVMTVYDSCVGSAVHRLSGLGCVTCLDLLSGGTYLTVAVASSMKQPRLNMPPLIVSEITVLTCQEGKDWQTLVVRPHHESNCYPSAVSKQDHFF